MIIALVVVVLLLFVAACFSAARWHAHARAYRGALMITQQQLRDAEDNLRKFQLEQTELLLRSSEGKAKSEEPTPFEMGYVYRSLGVEPPAELVEAERARDEVLDGILRDLKRA